MNDTIKQIIWDQFKAGKVETVSLDRDSQTLVLDMSSNVVEAMGYDSVIDALRHGSAHEDFLEYIFTKKVVIRIDGRPVYRRGYAAPISMFPVEEATFSEEELQIKRDNPRKYKKPAPGAKKKPYAAVNRVDAFEYIQAHGGFESYEWDCINKELFNKLIHKYPDVAGRLFSMRHTLLSDPDYWTPSPYHGCEAGLLLIGFVEGGARVPIDADSLGIEYRRGSLSNFISILCEHWSRASVREPWSLVTRYIKDWFENQHVSGQLIEVISTDIYKNKQYLSEPCPVSDTEFLMPPIPSSHIKVTIGVMELATIRFPEGIYFNHEYLRMPISVWHNNPLLDKMVFPKEFKMLTNYHP